MLLVYFGVAAAVLLSVLQIFMTTRVAKLRRSGRYPERGKATMADVKRLSVDGSRSLAVRCYREVHPSSLREAVDAVRLLSTIKTKDEDGR